MVFRKIWQQLLQSSILFSIFSKGPRMSDETPATLSTTIDTSSCTKVKTVNCLKQEETSRTHFLLAFGRLSGANGIFLHFLLRPTYCQLAPYSPLSALAS